jgi:hypothetical protein
VGKSRSIRRNYIELVGLRRVDCKFIVHNNNLVNILRALVERVYNVEVVMADGSKGLQAPPMTTRRTFFSNMSDFREKLLINIAPVSRMSHSEFVATSPAHKRKIYEFAHADYLKRGLSPRDAWVTSFVKAEKVAVKADKPDPAPRIIQPRGVKFNLVFGSFIRPAEKQIYRAIDRVYGRPTVVCGQNAAQTASMLYDAWTEITDPIAISLDLSRMDQHISVSALNWEHSIYRRIFKHDTCYDTLEWCLQRTVKNEGRAYVPNQYGSRRTIKYSKTGSRMSGDMNTSLGNKVIMCGLLYSYYVTHCGLKPRVDVNVVDNGDDCVVILSRTAYAMLSQRTKCTQRLETLALTDPANWREVYLATREVDIPNDLEDVSAWFLKMGFTLKVEGLTDKFQHIDFCQTRPCFIDGRWIMVRGLKALSKDCYCLKHKDYLERWLSQVRTGGLNAYGSTPVFSAFYNTFPKGTDTGRNLLVDSGLYYLSRGMVSGTTISDSNRMAFFETFGVTEREQVAIESYYQSMTYSEHPDPNNPGILLPLPWLGA